MMSATTAVITQAMTVCIKGSTHLHIFGFSKFFFMKRMHALPPALGQSAQNLKSLPLVLQNITPYLF